MSVGRPLPLAVPVGLPLVSKGAGTWAPAHVPVLLDLSLPPATQLGPLSVPDFSSKLKCGPSIGVVMSQHTDSEGLTHGASCVSNVALFKPCPQRWVQSPAVNTGLQGTLHACHLLEFVREAHELKILSCSRQGSLGLGTSTEHSAP